MHTLSTGHIMNIKNAVVLEEVPDYHMRRLKESIYINKLDTVNIRHDSSVDFDFLNKAIFEKMLN